MDATTFGFAPTAQADSDAQMFLGNALVEAGRLDEAVAAYRAALALRPDHGPTHYNLGNALLRLGQPEAAEASYRQALHFDPGHVGTHNNLGNIRRSQGRMAEAAECYRAALARQPELAGTRTNLGAVLIARREPEAAVAHLREAVRLNPEYAEAANLLGGALLALDRLDEALPWFERAQALDPDLVQAEFGRAMVLLAQGRWPEGWADYEARWRDPEFVANEPARAAPVWDGRGAVAGKTVLLHAEQGLGDTIQFARYAPLVRARGARVVLEVQPSLVAMCRDLADAVIAAGTEPPSHDMRCPLLSLPRAFATSVEAIPACIPYLHAAPSRQLRAPGCNIGVVLSGDPAHPEDDLRSVPANLWWPVLRLPATFHLLQPELRPQDAAVLSALPGLRRHALPDFAATASVVAAMDVVVSVDTSVAHLAGALGRPVMLLLQYSADFRWLRGRDDSPWYPTARLFRRGADEGWSAVLRRVAEALAGRSGVRDGATTAGL